MTDAQENRRGASRLHHELPIAWRGEGGFRSGCATDMSASGLFINARDALPVGTALRLLVSLPVVDAPLELAGRVARVAGADGGAPGMGVRFTDVDDARGRQLDGMLRRLRRDLGA